MKNEIRSFCFQLREIAEELGGAQGFIPLHEPFLNQNDVESVSNCIKSGFVSTAGKSVPEFEAALARFVGAEYCVAVNSGTDALKLSIMGADITQGTEILVPAVSFIASANAVVHAGCIPHFVDVSLIDMGVDVEKLSRYLKSITRFENGVLKNIQTGRDIAAIIPVHCHGYACSIEELKNLSQEFGITVIEDAAEGLGTFVQTKNHVGTFGLAGALSFNGNKIITTGGGGAVVTNSRAVYEKVRHLSTQARLALDGEFQHDEVGFNNRLPSINAALGLSQLAKIDELLTKKRELHRHYRNKLNSPLGTVYAPENQDPNHWLITFKFHDALQAKDIKFLNECAREVKLGLRSLWNLLPEQLPYRTCPSSDLSGSKNLYCSAVALPSSPGLWTL